MTLTKLLNNYDLEYYCKLLKIPLKAVLNKDLFQKIKAEKGGYIINLQNSNEGPGTHWTCLYIFEDIALYYDSFGIIMPQSIIKFCRKFNPKIRIVYSIDQIQHIDSIYCGWFCLLFLYYMNRNKNAKQKAELINSHNSMFETKEKHKRIGNDNKLKKIIKKIFLINI